MFDEITKFDPEIFPLLLKKTFSEVWAFAESFDDLRRCIQSGSIVHSAFNTSKIAAGLFRSKSRKISAL